jgi:hypothetical protein
VVHGSVTSEECSHLAVLAGNLVVLLPDDQTLETLDEDQMRGEGWQRHYFSTACLHDEHETCRKVCKFCPEKCRCACHKEGQT